MTFGTKLKQIRQSKGLSLSDLSKLCDVSTAMLSKIENNEKVPTIRVAGQIANALSLSLSDLVGDHKKPKVSVIKKDQRKIIFDPVSGTEGQLLSPGFPSTTLNFIFATLPPKASTGNMQPHSHGYEEYLLVSQGRLRVILNETDNYDLEVGDTIHFEADVLHEIINLDNQESHYYLILHNQP